MLSALVSEIKVTVCYIKGNNPYVTSVRDLLLLICKTLSLSKAAGGRRQRP